MLIPMACSSSHCVVITLLTYVVWVLVLPRKVKFMFNWISRCILMQNEYWFYPGKLLLLSEDLNFTLKYTCIHVLLIGWKKNENLLIQAFMMLCQTQLLANCYTFWWGLPKSKFWIIFELYRIKKKYIFCKYLSTGMTSKCCLAVKLEGPKPL